MAGPDSELDSRTLQFGLRDFLFYLVPGGVTLAAVLVFNLETWRDEFTTLGVGAAVVGLLGAYFFGQLVYPVTYLLRSVFARKRTWSHPEGLLDAEMTAIEEYPRYYASVVFRDRSFARFSLAMVFPTLLLAVAAGVHAYRLSREDLAGLFVVLGAAAATGFLYRYRHYEARFCDGLERCLARSKTKQLPPNTALEPSAPSRS